MIERKAAEDNENPDHIEYLNQRIEDAQSQLCDLTGKLQKIFICK